MNAAWLIGLDVGGTKIAGGLVDPVDGRVVSRAEVPTRPARGGEAVLTDALALAEGFQSEAIRRGGAIVGIGIGVAELVNPSGEIYSNHTIGWQGLPVQERFVRIAPTTVEADVRAAALAEARFGAGRDVAIFMYVTVGTGISACLVQDGRPFAGARGGALVMATAPFTVTCHACRATTDHVLEDEASGPALVNRYRQMTGTETTRAEEILAVAAAGDEPALTLVTAAGVALGNSVAFLVNTLDPALVVVGGGLGLAGGRYWDAFVAATRDHIWNEAARSVPIVPARLGLDAGLIGAAMSASPRPRASAHQLGEFREAFERR